MASTPPPESLVLTSPPPSAHQVPSPVGVSRPTQRITAPLAGSTALPTLSGPGPSPRPSPTLYLPHPLRTHKPLPVPSPEHRALRLVDGGSSCAGRVEMLEYGQWGSVCDDTWDLEDAHVVCRQLSCGWAIQALPGLHFAPGRGLIHRDQVNCSGAEDYLWDCPGLPGDGYCGHKEDAGVICSGE